ncbi:hypothetical protein [Riemerella columbipharyngis]|nr:hypothetical protein [Riemerella columbipharyngis]
MSIEHVRPYDMSFLQNEEIIREYITVDLNKKIYPTISKCGSGLL